MNAEPGWDAFAAKKYLSLETYRKTGAGVRTPVWFAAAPDEPGGPVLYVYSTADSGKAKRIRRSGSVRIAPCDARGRVTGDWIAAHAAIAGDAAYERGMRLLNRKYWPLKPVMDVFVRLFVKHERVMIAIRPV